MLRGNTKRSRMRPRSLDLPDIDVTLDLTVPKPRASVQPRSRVKSPEEHPVRVPTADHFVGPRNPDAVSTHNPHHQQGDKPWQPARRPDTAAQRIKEHVDHNSSMKIKPWRDAGRNAMNVGDDPTDSNYEDKPVQRRLPRAAYPPRDYEEPDCAARLRGVGERSESRTPGGSDFGQLMKGLPRGVSLREQPRAPHLYGTPFEQVRRCNDQIATHMSRDGQRYHAPLYDKPEFHPELFGVTEEELAKDASRARLYDLNNLNRRVAIRNALRAAGGSDPTDQELGGPTQAMLDPRPMRRAFNKDEARDFNRLSSIQRMNKALRTLEEGGVPRHEALEIVQRSRTSK
jgi:hypothetical protein